MQNSINFLAEVICTEIWIVLASLGLIVLFKVVTSNINLFGLIADKRTGNISSMRIQSLIFTCVAAVTILSDILTITDIDSNITALLFGGSQAVYLHNKRNYHQTRR